MGGGGTPLRQQRSPCRHLPTLPRMQLPKLGLLKRGRDKNCLIQKPQPDQSNQGDRIRTRDLRSRRDFPPRPPPPKISAKMPLELHLQGKGSASGLPCMCVGGGGVGKTKRDPSPGCSSGSRIRRGPYLLPRESPSPPAFPSFQAATLCRGKSRPLSSRPALLLGRICRPHASHPFPMGLQPRRPSLDGRGERPRRLLEAELRLPLHRLSWGSIAC